MLVVIEVQLLFQLMTKWRPPGWVKSSKHPKLIYLSSTNMTSCPNKGIDCYCELVKSSREISNIL